MELSVMNKHEENDAETDNAAKKTQERKAQAAVDSGERALIGRFNPNVVITNEMMWHPPMDKTTRRSQKQKPGGEPAWGQLLKQVVVGVIELLIPLSFIIGMIYWRVPWLFWAVVHFLRGEPVFRF